MTNEEAIETLKRNYPSECFEQLREAVDMAISALEKRIPKEPTEEAHDEKALSYNLYCPTCGKVIGYRGTITGRIAQKYAKKTFAVNAVKRLIGEKVKDERDRCDRSGKDFEKRKEVKRNQARKSI